MNSINVTPERQRHGMTQDSNSASGPLVFTVVLHIVVLAAFIWFGRNLVPLPEPKHIKAVMISAPKTDSNAPATPEQTSTPAPSNATAKAAEQREQLKAQREEAKAETARAEKRAIEVAAAAVAAQKAEALAAEHRQKQIERTQAQEKVLQEKQAAAKAAAKQAEIEQAYALKQAEQKAEKLKAERLKALAQQEEAKKAQLKADEKARAHAEKLAQQKTDAELAKKQAAKEAAENAKQLKENANKDAKAAQEKAAKLEKEKAAKEQAFSDAKEAKEKAAKEAKEKANAAKASAEARRKLLTQSLGDDDAEVSNLKGQVAAQAKANSIGKYKSQIESRIKNAWKVPSASSGLKATARITLTPDGSIASIVITSSSGNDDFDTSIKALRSHGGLPVPDDSDTFRQVNPLVITFRAP
ncbi:cell envelope integrity protein TolA [Aquirhabdus sp.]|uniref:cell envelope integrity protein TolA n=1 Tax=Aquirhabdus sp. TaxID=2824160 RepID=UPI00396C6A29